MTQTQHDSRKRRRAQHTAHAVDGLTGLPGMTRFYSLAQAACADMRARGEHPVALALNLVGMKTFNTRYGHSEGDNLLRTFADVMRKHFGSESCARFADDHFYAFAQEEGLTQKMAHVFDDFCSADLPATLPIRVGAYACDSDDDICEVGFDRARIACELDTTTWRSSLHWFTEDMRSEARLRLHVCGSIDRAIDEGWIHPLYQPIVRSATGAVCGEEALARWDDPKFGELMPERFIPMLEEAGLSYKLDLYMIDCVLADLRIREEAGVSLVPVSVNISPFDFSSIDFVQELVQRVDAAGISHSLVCLELAESMSTYDLDTVAPYITDLRRAGFHVWLDNFANNYVSLRALTILDLDGIKLGMDFLHGAMDEKTRQIVEGVIRTATQMGVRTLAEGVETAVQAELLNQAGCSLLQGHLFFRPLRLDVLIAHALADDAIHREPLEERTYWDAVSAVDLDNLTVTDETRDSSDAELSELPAGVVENRNGTWHIVRANSTYSAFLHASGLLSPTTSSTSPAPMLNPRPVTGKLDSEYFDAASAARATGVWQRIAGRLEYGSSFQYFVRHLASADKADAYLIGGIPTMLGTVIGSYGDIPAAYAVFRVILNEARDEVIDMEYVYANDLYCTWVGCDFANIAGRSFISSVPRATPSWFPYCHRAVVLGEEVHDMMYSPEVGHWLVFNIAPSPVKDHCVCAFAIADEERRERSELWMGRAVSDLIVLIADALDNEVSYDIAVQNLLATLRPIMRADRLYVMELHGDNAVITAEEQAAGVTPRSGVLRALSRNELDTWNAYLWDGSVSFIRDTINLAGASAVRRAAYAAQGVRNGCVIPLFGEEELIGYLGIDNYAFDSNLDSEHLLRALGSFLGARLYNHRLMQQLKDASMLDGLTGVLNRRGIDMTVAERFEQSNVSHYALILMDIDDFKTINDVYGHDVGDAALCTIARCLTQQFPPGAIVGRNGGDEFFVMLINDDAERTDELIRDFLATDLTCTVNGTSYRATMSVGYVTYPDVAHDLRDAYHKADEALYAVKLGGKFGYDHYQESMTTQHRSQLGFTPRDIATNLPGAILVHRPDDAQVLFANDELVTLLECDDLHDFMEFTGGTFWGIMHPEDRARMCEDELNGTSVPVSCTTRTEYRIVTKQGAIRHATEFSRTVEVEGMGKLFYKLIVCL